MDILEIEDVLKGLPDQALRQEAQQPSGQVPQYMVVSEIQRRSKMRKRFEAQKEQPSTTVAEQILTGGVASVAPPPPQMMGAMGMPQQPPAPPQQPPMGQQQPPMQPQQMPPQQPPMPQQGAPMPPPVQMAGGGLTVGGAGIEDSIRTVLVDYGIPADVLKLDPKFSQYASLIDKVSADMMSGVDVYDAAKAKANIPYGQEFDPVGPMPTEISPFGTYSATTERTMPRIGDVKASDIYGDVSLPSLPDLPMIGTTPELQRQRAREEMGGIGSVAGSTPEEFEAMRGRLLPTEEERKAKTQERIQSNLITSRGFDATAGSMTLGEAIESGQVLSPEIKGLVRKPFDAVGDFFKERRQSSLDEIRQRYMAGIPMSQNEMSFYDKYGPGMESLEGLFGSGVFDEETNELLEIAATPYGSQQDSVVVDPKQSMATQNDSAKLNLDTATKTDAPLLNMALSEKNPMDYGLTDFSIDPDLQRQANEIIGDRSELKQKGTPDIQTQGIKYVSPEIPELVAPSFAGLISEQERRLAKIREDAKRDVSAQALINLGAGVMEGDVAGGLRAAGQAASKVRTAERAAESDIANLQSRIKMAEEQGKFDTAKALRADALKEAQFEATFGLKRGELAQTLQLAEARIEAEGNTEEGRMLRARLTALNDLAARLQAQIVTTGRSDPATDAALQQSLSQLQSLLGVKVAGSDDSDPLGLKKTG